MYNHWLYMSGACAYLCGYASAIRLAQSKVVGHFAVFILKQCMSTTDGQSISDTTVETNDKSLLL